MSCGQQSEADGGTFLRSTGVVVIAGIGASLLQISFHWVAARQLSPGTYANVNTLLSILFMAGLPVSVIQTGVATSIAELAAQGRFDVGGDLLRRTIRGLLWPAVCCGGALVVGSPVLARHLRVEPVSAVAVTGPIVALLVLLPVWRGAAQGLRNFAVFGLSQLSEGTVRLLALGVALRFHGGATGVVGTSLAALLAAMLTIAPALRRLSKTPGLRVRVPASEGARLGDDAASRADVSHSSRSPADASEAFDALRRFLVPVSAALTCFALISNVDVVLVKAFFPLRVAGDYAAAAVVARAVLYISVAVTTVMLPTVAHQTAQAKKPRRVLVESLAISGLMCGTCAAVLALFATGIATAAFGVQYAGIGPLVRGYALALLPMVPLNTLINYELGRNRTAFLRVLVPLTILHVTLVYAFHADAAAVLGISAVSRTFSGLALTGYLLLQWRRETVASGSRRFLR